MQWACVFILQAIFDSTSVAAVVKGTGAFEDFGKGTIHVDSREGEAPSFSPQLRQQPIQLIGEVLFVPGTVGSRASGFHA